MLAPIAVLSTLIGEQQRPLQMDDTTTIELEPTECALNFARQHGVPGI
jgi:hypothetical protein